MLWFNANGRETDLDVIVEGPEGTINYIDLVVGNGRLDTDCREWYSGQCVENVICQPSPPAGSYTITGEGWRSEIFFFAFFIYSRC